MTTGRISRRVETSALLTTSDLVVLFIVKSQEGLKLGAYYVNFAMYPVDVVESQEGLKLIKGNGD